MASYNKVILMGNLVADPEIKTLPSGTLTARFSIAVNERYKNSEGEFVEEAHFFEVDVFGRQAEIAQEYLKKGRPVFVEGSLRQNRWETDDGQKRSKVRIKCRRFIMMSRAGEPPEAAGEPPEAAGEPPEAAGEPPEAAGHDETPAEAGSGDAAPEAEPSEPSGADGADEF